MLNYPKIYLLGSTGAGKTSMSCLLKVGDSYVMDFPIQALISCDISREIEKAFGAEPKVCFASMDYIVVFEDENDVTCANPNLHQLKQLDLRGVCITAKSEKYDFVTRFFAPKFGIDEDSVTSSAFTQLVSYWQDELGKDFLFAKQVSTRGGEVKCEIIDDRVLLYGDAVKYLEGTINI